MAIAFGIAAIISGLWAQYAIDEPKPNQAMAVISVLLCVAFLAAAVLVH